MKIPYLVAISLLCFACGDDDASPDSSVGSDGGPIDSGPRVDGGPDFDGGPIPDAGPADANGPDGMTVDAGPSGPVCQRDGLDLGDNHPPVVFWPKPTTAHPGMPFEFSLISYDPDNDTLRYSLSGAPDGMTIDGLGVIRFMPSDNDTYEVVATVADGRGGVVTQAFSLEVTTSGFLFVAPGGNDGASGAMDAPFATIEHGLAAIKRAGGGTLVIRGGDYDVEWNWEVEGVVSPMGGTDFSADTPADIRGYPGEDVVILADGGHGLWAFNNSYVLISNLEIRGASAGERGGALAHGDHIVFHDVTVRDSDWSSRNNCTGFLLSGGDIVVHRSQAYDNYGRGGDGVSSNNSNYLVYNSGPSTDHAYILHSRSGGTIGAGAKIKHSGQGSLTVHGFYDDGSSMGFLGADDGVTLAYSSFVNNGTGISVGVSGPAGPGYQMHVHHNTVVNFTGSGVAFQDGYLQNADFTFEANILVSNIALDGREDGSPKAYRVFPYEDRDLSGITFANNCFSLLGDDGFRQGSDYYTFTEWQGQGHDGSSIRAEPIFLAPDDLRLSPGSGCLALGIEVGANICE